jgi:hypothetical protein
MFLERGVEAVAVEAIAKGCGRGSGAPRGLVARDIKLPVVIRHRS